jgi:hypothetical protein
MSPCLSQELPSYQYSNGTGGQVKRLEHQNQLSTYYPSSSGATSQQHSFHEFYALLARFTKPEIFNMRRQRERENMLWGT